MWRRNLSVPWYVSFCSVMSLQSVGVPDFVLLPVLVVRSWVAAPRLVGPVFLPIEVRRRVEI